MRASETAPAWMSGHGARWQQALRGTLSLARTNRFFLGGGKALLMEQAASRIAFGADLPPGEYRLKIICYLSNFLAP